MNDREIENRLRSIGSLSKEIFTKQEMIDYLKELQDAIARAACGPSDNSPRRATEIASLIEKRVINLGIQDSDAFLRFKADMNDLGKELALAISGISGEAKGFRALRALELDADTYMLRNIHLKSETGETEVDALVIAPYGVFIIEMKNCKKPLMITEDGFLQKADNPDYQYPLGERMCCKESLVREALATELDIPVLPVLFLVNDSDLTDRFGRIMTANRSTVVYKIRSYAKTTGHLPKEQISTLVNKIEARSHKAEYTCKLDCDRIIENFLELMKKIEEAETNKRASVEAPKKANGIKRYIPAALASSAAVVLAICPAIFGPLAARIAWAAIREKQPNAA